MRPLAIVAYCCLLVACAGAARVDRLRHVLTGSSPRFELHESKVVSHSTCTTHHNRSGECFKSRQNPSPLPRPPIAPINAPVARQWQTPTRAPCSPGMPHDPHPCAGSLRTRPAASAVIERSALPTSFFWGDYLGVNYLTETRNQHIPQCAAPDASPLLAPL
jgi:hypothetical protein